MTLDEDDEHINSILNNELEPNKDKLAEKKESKGRKEQKEDGFLSPYLLTSFFFLLNHFFRISRASHQNVFVRSFRKRQHYLYTHVAFYLVQKTGVCLEENRLGLDNRKKLCFTFEVTLNSFVPKNVMLPVQIN